MSAVFPVAFTAHGNPMNALGHNPFSAALQRWSAALNGARAVVCVSAHWQSEGVWVTVAERPATIHDFWGFPEELNRLRYPAPGDPGLARRAASLLEESRFDCEEDPDRGLDHGAWAPLLFLRPSADVPVVQISLPLGIPLEDLVLLGQALSPLRRDGILILGSGNLVHNLAAADLRRKDAPVPSWAVDFDSWVEDALLAGDLEALARPHAAPGGAMAHPTLEHYAPLLVCAGAAEGDKASFAHESFEHGTIGMRCVQFG